MNDQEMEYLDYFKISSNPFPIAPDDKIFYLSSRIDRILTEVIHGVIARKGFMVLTGDVGVGKTTMSRRILRILEEKGVETSLVFQTACRDAELLREINRDFGLENSSQSLGDQMKSLNDFLLEKNTQNKNCAIIIDDAQNLDSSSLELVRMISNFEADQQKLVQIVLVGQPELEELLDSKQLRQLRSRIVIWKKAWPLNRKELKSYLLFKLNLAGGSGRNFIKNNAFRKIHALTKGNLRKVNLLMDRCLYAGFLKGRPVIDKGLVKYAFMDIEKGGRNQSQRVVVMALLAVAAGLGFGMSYYHYDFFQKLFKKPETQAHQQPPKLVEIKKILPPTAGIAILKDISPLQKKVLNFLSAYGLSDYFSEFSKALAANSLEGIFTKISRNTGYFLIQLHSLPDSISAMYPVLSCTQENSKENLFLLFWKPLVHIDRFYYGAQGPEIQKLQERLSQTGFYNYGIDGSVGKHLMKALIKFQEKNGIPVTGNPDEKTLFLLFSGENHG